MVLKSLHVPPGVLEKYFYVFWTLNLVRNKKKNFFKNRNTEENRRILLFHFRPYIIFYPYTGHRRTLCTLCTLRKVTYVSIFFFFFFCYSLTRRTGRGGSESIPWRILFGVTFVEGRSWRLYRRWKKPNSPLPSLPHLTSTLFLSLSEGGIWPKMSPPPYIRRYSERRR